MISDFVANSLPFATMNLHVWGYTDERGRFIGG